MSGRTAFVSSHSSFRNFLGDDYHRIAIEVARQYRISAHGMDQHPAGPDLEGRCRESVRHSDVLILIVGWSYGTPHAEGLSLTEIEWRFAQKCDKDVVALMLDTPAPEDADEEELARAREFRAHFDRPGRRPLYGRFHDRPSFELALGQALLALVEQGAQKPLTRGSPEIRDKLDGALKTWRPLDERRVPLSGVLTRPGTPAAEVDEHLREVVGYYPEAAPDEVTVLSAMDSCFPSQERLIVVGEFGSGKTTFLERLRVASARRLVDNGLPARAPLLVNLGGWSRETHDFASFIHQEAARFYGSRVAGGDLHLLLDEADNREAPLDGAAAREIADWFANHDSAWGAVAVRQTAGLAESLTSDRRFAPFARLEVAAVDRLQRQAFINRTTAPGPKRNELLDLIERLQASGDDNVIRMLGSPFNLSLLAGFTWGRHDVPANGPLMIRASVRTAYARHQGQAPATASYDGFVTYLGGLAVRALGELRPDRIDDDVRGFYDRVATTINAFEVTPHGLTWTGSYLAYFAAEALATDPELLARAIERHRPTRTASWLAPALRELVQLAPDLFGELALGNPVLAASCFRHLPAARREQAAYQSFNVLSVMLDDRAPDVHASVANALAAIGDDVLPHIRGAMDDDKPWRTKRLLDALVRLGTMRAIELLVRALEHSNKWVADDAARAIIALDAPRCQHVVTFIERFRGTDVSTDDRMLLRGLADLNPQFRRPVDEILGSEAKDAADVAGALDDPGGSLPAIDRDAFAYLEPYEEDASGASLLAQLRLAPADEALIARCRAWLRHSDARDRAWPHIWGLLWEKGADRSLAEEGRHWLAREVSAGPWGHVFARLLTNDRTNAGLAAIGQRWLHDHETATGWPHVWSALFDTRQTPTLTDWGFEWLRRPAHTNQNWGLVWKRLSQWVVAPDAGDRSRQHQQAELVELGTSLLRTTAFDDEAWGFVFPTLAQWEPARAGLRELGGLWVETAPPTSLQWGYVFPAAWRLNKGAPQLRAVAVEWLVSDVCRDRDGWAYVWGAIVDSHDIEPALQEAAVQFIDRAPADSPAWRRPWIDLWKRHCREDQLLAIGHARMLGASPPPDHGGWAWMVPAVLNAYALTPELLQRGREYLEPPYRPGWGPVWEALDGSVRRHPPFADAIAPLAKAARGWLNHVGVDARQCEGVWLRLWSRSPDDALRSFGFERLRRHPRTASSVAVALQLAESGLQRRTEIDACVNVLQSTCSGTAGRQWASLWLKIWPDNRSDALRAAAFTWLKSGDALDHEWWRVWKDSWHFDSSNTEMIDCAVAALTDGAASSSEVQSYWGIAWPDLWRAGVRDPRLLAAAVARLRTTADPSPFWRSVARALAEEHRLPDDVVLPAGVLEYDPTVTDAVLTWPVTSAGWLRRWDDAWYWPQSHPRLWEPAIEWLKANFAHKAFAPIWRKVYSSNYGRNALIVVGHDWLLERPLLSKGWGFVFDGVVRAGRRDAEILRQGRQFVLTPGSSRNTWPVAWAAMWDLEIGSRSELSKAGHDWLAVTHPSTFEYYAVWSRLWDADSERPALRPLGEAFVREPALQSGREDVAHRLGLAPG